MTQRLISRYLEQDVERGEVVRVLGSVTRNGLTTVQTLNRDGHRMNYHEASVVAATGEIAYESE